MAPVRSSRVSFSESLSSWRLADGNFASRETRDEHLVRHNNAIYATRSGNSFTG